MPQTTTDCHILPLTGLNASVKTGFNAQRYEWMGWVGPLTSSFLHSTHFLLVVKSEICVKSMLDPSPWALPPAFYIAPKCVKSQNHQPFTMMMKGERLGSGTY